MNLDYMKYVWKKRFLTSLKYEDELLENAFEEETRIEKRIMQFDNFKMTCEMSANKRNFHVCSFMFTKETYFDAKHDFDDETPLF